MCDPVQRANGAAAANDPLDAWPAFDLAGWGFALWRRVQMLAAESAGDRGDG